jgi:hypothetical protein
MKILRAAATLMVVSAVSVSPGAVAEAADAHAAEGAAADSHRGEALARLRQLVKSEPTIREVQRDAVRFYQLEPERIRSLMRSARVKALLPEVDAGIDGTLGHSFNDTHDALYPTFTYKQRDVGSSDQLVWHVHAAWDLSRALFNAEQLDVVTLNSLQETLVREVTTLYFARHRTMAALLLSPPQDDEELYDQQQRLQEMTATVDAFTGGRFAARAWSGESP